MRWQEEVTLIGYEMQWTVRYFRYMSSKWILSSDHDMLPIADSSGTGTGPPVLTAGAVAYWKRKYAIWNDLCSYADGLFRRCNSAYESPI